MARAIQQGIDLGEMRLDRLTKLRDDILEEIETRKQAEVEAIREELRTKSEALGVTVEEIMGIQRTRRPYNLQPATPKFKGPNGELWSGKGPAPRWMKPFLLQGKTKDDFRIAA